MKFLRAREFNEALRWSPFLGDSFGDKCREATACVDFDVFCKHIPAIGGPWVLHVYCQRKLLAAQSLCE
jgi:hypothetical protein